MKRNAIHAGLAAALLLLSVGTANAATIQRKGINAVPDQYIVVLKNDAASRATPIRTLAQRLVGTVGGGEVLQNYDHTVRGFSVRLPKAAIEALANNPAIERIEEDQFMELVETQFNAPYNLDRVDQRALPLSGSYSYPAGAGGGVHVYVIDTGLRASHTDFAGRVGAGRNFAPNRSTLLCTLLGLGCPAPVPTDTTDCNGHGTHVSGTAVGSTYGAAKGAIVHPVRVFSCGGTTATSTIIAGVDWVTANRQLPAVANLSLGGGVSDTLDQAVQAMIGSGVVAVVAAGNDNADACNSSPARLPAAITVGATTSTDARASYSNYGGCLDVFAPGSNVVSASYQNDTGTSTLSGTSMASPLVAGIVARYLATSAASAAQAEAALVAASTPNVVTSAGAGSPNRLVYAAPN
ncbi:MULTISPECIES: S8 family peptidase [Hydrocarboniphaga]|uniref:S8 family peptidase n=2 Tax=Nevskiaceae TaxID=568386 RepID=UPI002AB999C5|nr:S8 family peptidase [Hydrocarboniphaga sp.]MDZ4078069.1 S8 family peptidase [Hydrocarboniphaga sp.]